MGKTIKVRKVVIGEGIPKICVPIVGTTKEDLQAEARQVTKLNPDLVEWRIDFFKEIKNIDKIVDTLDSLRNIVADIPILFTFRSAREGGNCAVDDDFYIEMNQRIMETKKIDLIDVELFNTETVVTKMVAAAKKNKVYVIMSNHDFHKTPEKEEIVKRLRRMAELGADIVKIAVMPNTASDVLTLLSATNEAKEKYNLGPIITMSMSGLGVISRMAGETFGSAVTFGAGKEASAPGQIAVADLRKVLEIVHLD